MAYHGPLPAIVNPAAFDGGLDQEWPGTAAQRISFILTNFTPARLPARGPLKASFHACPICVTLASPPSKSCRSRKFPETETGDTTGASLYAPQSSYGGPAGLKQLVDACHRHGLAVVLDVVYNHLGPEGNYLPEFALLLHRHATTHPGERRINFDGPGSDGIRRFIIDNALYWLTEFTLTRCAWTLSTVSTTSALVTFSTSCRTLFRGRRDTSSARLG